MMECLNLGTLTLAGLLHSLLFIFFPELRYLDSELRDSHKLNITDFFFSQVEWKTYIKPWLCDTIHVLNWNKAETTGR